RRESCLVHVQGGSVLRGDVVELTTVAANAELSTAEGALRGERGLTLRLPGGKTTVIQWSDVTRLEIQSDRFAYLSNLTPIEVREQPLVAPPRGWKRDRSVCGHTLTLGDETYEHGLGVASRSELVYAL